MKEKLSPIAPVFILSLAVPLIFYVGPIRLSPYRVLLLVMFVPVVMAWISGRAGPVRTPDVLILLASLWAFLALSVNHGIARAVEPGGIYLVECFGGYLLARTMVRNHRTFLAVARTHLILVAIMLPLALVESVSANKVVLRAFSALGAVLPPAYNDPRWGLARVQGGFEHPILYGTFVASALGLSVLALGYRWGFFRRLLTSMGIGGATFLSLSTGPLTALAAQLFFLFWNAGTRWLRRRWTVLGGLFALSYVAVDMLSNRTPFHVFVTYLTFNVRSSYNRILIFDFGMQNVEQRPFFGAGLNDWDRPSWMSASMDNFWLVFAVQFGVPMFLLVFAALLLVVRRLSLVELGEPKLAAARAGLLVTIGGLAVAGATVHFWNATFVWFMFLLGAGMWMLDIEGAAPKKENRRARLRRTSRDLSG